VVDNEGSVNLLWGGQSQKEEGLGLGTCKGPFDVTLQKSGLQMIGELECGLTKTGRLTGGEKASRFVEGG